MLPNLKFVACGILFCILLFAAAGAGVTLPDSRTRIGETPATGHPMVQQSIAETPAQGLLYMTKVGPRSDEPGGLRGQAGGEAGAATAQAGPGRSAPDVPQDLPKEPPKEPPKPDVVANAPAADSPTASRPRAIPLLDAARQADAAAAARDPSATQTLPRDNDRSGAAAPQDVAAVAPPAAGDGATVAPFVSIPLPPLRPAVFGGEHGRLPHHRQRLIPSPDTTAAPVAGPGASIAP